MTKWHKVFCTLDLRAGYHHIPLDEESIPKTTFTLPFGKYEYIKVPFRLVQAPAYFQALMTGILKDFNFTIAYLDGIIIFSKAVEEHLDHKTCFQEAKKCTPINETQQVSLFHEGNLVFRSHTKH